MEYQFFVRLTNEVDRLVGGMAARNPGSFMHAGMDLSRIFARRVYIAGSYDAALYDLFARGDGISDRPRPAFSNDLVYLLARSWFGAARTGPVPPRFRLERLLRPLRLLAGVPSARFRSGRAKSDRADLLLFATSVRFARFLAPIARAFAGRCAFLVRQENRAVRDWLEAEGYAVTTYFLPGPDIRPLNTALARFAPGAVLEVEAFHAVLERLRPRAVVLPEGNAPEDEAMSRAGAQLRIPVACVQQGWSPLVHTGFRDLTFASMMVWGEGLADLLRPASPGQLFCTVGNYNLPEDAVEREGVAFFGVGTGGWVGDEADARLLLLAAKIATALPDTPVYFRPHPRDPIPEELLRPLRALPNVKFSNAAEPLAPLLSKIQVGVSIYSSTLLECAASGALPLIFNITSMPHYSPNMAAAGAAVEVGNEQDAFMTLRNLLADPSGPKSFEHGLSRFRAQFCPYRGKAALARIVAELERLMALRP